MLVYCRVESVLYISRSITFSYVITGRPVWPRVCSFSVREPTLVVPRAGCTQHWRPGGMSTGEDATSIGGTAAPPAAARPAPRTRTLGSLHEFRPDSEDFSTYMERVEIYFAANDVPEEKQVPVFLNAVGTSTYGILRSLLAPDSPISKSLPEIIAKLRAHFEPYIIAERFKESTVNSGIQARGLCRAQLQDWSGDDSCSMWSPSGDH